MTEYKLENTAVRGVLITGGSGPPLEVVSSELSRAGSIIAADSGFDYAIENGIVVDRIVGDLDSVRNMKALHGLPDDTVIRIPHNEKDETDTEMGLRMLREMGYSDIVMIGGGGGRLDHLFGLFSLFERSFSPLIWYTDHAMVYRIDRRVAFRCRIGERVSFFPVGAEECNMETDGLKWPLDGLQWKRGDIGISNEAISDKIIVNMTRGRLIMICEYGRQEGIG